MKSDSLYLLSRIKWDRGLALLDPDHLLARFEICPGWCLARPHWQTAQDRERWLALCEPVAVTEQDLDEATNDKISVTEAMW